jgi:hypothetical protein
MKQTDLKQGRYYIALDESYYIKFSKDEDTLFLFKVTRNWQKSNRVYYRWWRNTGQTDAGKCWLPFHGLISELKDIKNISEEKAKMLINLWKLR